MNDNDLFRLSLRNEQAEIALLSGLLIAEGEALPDILSPPLEFQSAMLGDERHQEIFQAMYRLYLERTPITFVHLDTALAHQHTDYLMELYNYNLASPIYARHYAALVRESWEKLGMVDAATQLVAGVADGQASLEEAISKLSSLRASSKGREMTASEAIMAMTAQEYIGIPTGYSLLDYVTGGLVPTHLWIVDAFTSVGKTAYALNITANVLADGVPVLYFSLEQSIEELMLRLISMRSGVGGRKIRMDELSSYDQQKVDEAMDFYSRAPLVLFDDLYDIGAIGDKVEGRGVAGGVVIIDYLQNLRWDDMFKVMSNAAITAQALAKRERVTVIAISQISNTEAQQKDIGEFFSQKGSGAIRDAADLVIRLKRDRGSTALTAYILKHRQGPAGASLPFYFHLETGRITEVEREALNV